MKITIPESYRKYIQMLIQAEICRDEQAVYSRVLKDGLGEAALDAALIGGPDIDMDILEGRQISIEVPINPEQLELLEQVSQGYRLGIDEAAAIVFAQGLFEQYLELKATPLFGEDRSFRENVDSMPHDLFYDKPTLSDLFGDDQEDY